MSSTTLASRRATRCGGTSCTGSLDREVAEIDELLPLWKGGGVDERDLRLRALTYGLFVELGRAPTAGEVADACGLTETEVASGWWRLHEQHALVLDRLGLSGEFWQLA